VIGLDTNVLARYYIEDEGDPQAEKQRSLAARLLAGATALFVPKTVLLELEWVMREVYELPASMVAETLDHLLGLANVHIEDRAAVESALQAYQQGLDFADALHLASCASCTELVTFDERRFARRAERLKLKPPCRNLKS
jgi:predicted nucleic-acid-binding protein